VQHGLLDTQTTQKSGETIDPGWEDILQMAGRLTTRKLTYPTLAKGKSSSTVPWDEGLTTTNN